MATNSESGSASSRSAESCALWSAGTQEPAQRMDLDYESWNVLTRTRDEVVIRDRRIAHFDARNGRLDEVRARRVITPFDE
jgi:hypothetical protein